MALHDVDKTSGDRGTPQPNRHDTQDVPRLAHGTNSTNYVTPATVSSSNSPIKSGFARLVQSGVIATSVPNGVPGTINVNTTTHPHGLGYAPKLEAYMNNTSAGYNIQLPMIISAGDNTGGVGGAPEYLGIINWMFAGVDQTNVYIVSYNSGSSVATNYSITYYLYQQTSQ